MVYYTTYERGISTKVYHNLCANYLDNRAIVKEQEEWKQEQIEKYGKTFEQSEKEAKQLTQEIEETNQRAREMMKNW